MREIKLKIERALVKHEKKQRAAELVIANKELIFQKLEKGKRAAELITANKELAFQIAEKEKRIAELVVANKELESFSFISSHHLQEPLRKIQIFSNLILTEEIRTLSTSGKKFFSRIQSSAAHTQALIRDFLNYTSTKANEKLEKLELAALLEEVKAEFNKELLQQQATIEITGFGELKGIVSQIRQLFRILISNALKFSQTGQPPHIAINIVPFVSGTTGFKNILGEKNYLHISVSDNGIGFTPEQGDRVFEMFQRLNKKFEFPGTGMGLTLAKKIVEIHGGVITATGEIDKGALFEVYLPTA